MRPLMRELHKAEQEIDKKLKANKRCDHGNRPEECKTCKKAELHSYFRKGLEKKDNGSLQTNMPDKRN